MGWAETTVISVHGVWGCVDVGGMGMWSLGGGAEGGGVKGERGRSL